MDLSNIASNLSKGLKSIVHYNKGKNINNSNVRIDVGEQEHFCINVDNLMESKIISRSESSVCILVIYYDYTKDLLLIKWDRNRSNINNNDHIVLPMIYNNGIVDVPQYRYKDLFMHYNTCVSVSIRTYIEGRTLRSAYDSLSDSQLDIIRMQISLIVYKLQLITSTYFGRIYDGKPRTTLVNTFIQKRIIHDTNAKILQRGDCIVTEHENYNMLPVLCHMNLSPEHIILDGDNVVGIVGWNSADFVPELYDRLLYYFRSDREDPRDWFTMMSEVETSVTYDKIPSLLVYNMALYVYKRTFNTCSIERCNNVEKLWLNIMVNYETLSCLKYMIGCKGDTKSHELLDIHVTRYLGN